MTLEQRYPLLVNLRHADFTLSDLTDANLRYTDLSHADLSSADLSGADFTGAKFHDGFTGTSLTRVCQLTNVGSGKGTLIIINCAEGYFITRGCFRGSKEEFLKAVEKTHGDNEHGQFYRKIIEAYCL